MKITRLQVVIGVVVALVAAILVATLHGSGSDSIHYRAMGQAPQHND